MNGRAYGFTEYTFFLITQTLKSVEFRGARVPSPLTLMCLVVFTALVSCIPAGAAGGARVFALFAFLIFTRFFVVFVV